jgi:ABC-type glutathione transport system ATPase component
MEGTGSASAVNGLLNSERATATASASATSPELPIQSTVHEQATLRSSEDTTTHPAESVKECAGPAPVVLPLSQNPARTESITSQAEALLALPPPPSYDVHVQDLSVAVPPFRAYIPTPIPIPIPQAVTNLVRKRGSRDTGAPGEDPDGLIVRNVTATIRSGEMCALIGGSGSGKTTCEWCLAAFVLDTVSLTCSL